MIDKKEVEKISYLSRIYLSEEEKDTFTHQLVKILDYIGQLDKLDTTAVQPISQPLINELPLKEDKINEFKNISGLKKIAPDFKDGFFRVKKVI